ncbi:Gfo/Idh/MocA family protein [Plantactinospora sp. GCM10030261]|uniref:Gfo/Idh/MocA family protein n=1 Tax=Plantactinospora sp. GCM10030261 TaxID=3273420 RepID=UPI003618384E
MRVGIIGCGYISDIYLTNLTRLPPVEVVACADLAPERARASAERYGVPYGDTVATLLADPAVELVVNLTIPAAHAQVSRAAVAAGKHVYAEKPLATTGADGRALLAAARARGVRVGGAPDTFLGAGGQTCRALVDEGTIGTPVAAAATMVCAGHERWHPAPDFYYRAGGGPLFDMGPYYLTMLVNLLGPVLRATAVARASFPHRTTRDGRTIPVEVDTHVTAILEFVSGVTATVVMSFDVAASTVPHGIEVYGSTGTIALADPNLFTGPVLLGRGDAGWQDVPLRSDLTGNERGIGVAEMAEAIEAGREPRAGGELAQHVLDTMEAILAAARLGSRVDVGSTCHRPEPFTGLLRA